MAYFASTHFAFETGADVTRTISAEKISAKTFAVVAAVSGLSMSPALAQAPEQLPGAGRAAPTVSSSQIIGAQGADEWLASQLRGTAVIGADNQKIGEVVDVLLDRNGHARAFVVGVGGVGGLGAKEIAI